MEFCIKVRRIKPLKALLHYILYTFSKIAIMPPAKPVSSLTSITSDRVWQWLLHCVAIYQKPAERASQRACVSKMLNSNIRQDILNRTLSLHTCQLDAGRKCLLVELLGDRSTVCVDITQGGYLLIEEVFNLYRTITTSLLVNLVKFGFKCKLKASVDQKYIPDVNSFFYLILKNMHHLRWVSLTGVSNTELLTILGSACHQLEHLDVSDSWLISDESIASLLFKQPLQAEAMSLTSVLEYNGETNPCCSHLSFVCLQGTEATTCSIILLLRMVPNLISFGGYINEGSIIQAIGLIQSKDPHILFKLTEIWQDNIKQAHSCLLSSHCPNLFRVATNFVSLPNLHYLSHRLSSLTVECDFRSCEDELIIYFMNHGHNLHTVIFEDSINCHIDLEWIVEAIPSVKEIKMRLKCDDEADIAQWDKLQKATVSVDSSVCFYEFLTHTPSLNHLELTFGEQLYGEKADCINDELVIRVLVDGGLQMLNYLELGLCNIGEVGLDAILLNCLYLKNIGILSHWMKLTPLDIEKLVAHKLASNWDLCIMTDSKYL